MIGRLVFCFCPKCLKEEKIECKIAPLYAIPEEYMKRINPLLPASEVVPQLLNRFTIIVDCGFCYRRHGIVKLAS